MRHGCPASSPTFVTSRQPPSRPSRRATIAAMANRRPSIGPGLRDLGRRRDVLPRHQQDVGRRLRMEVADGEDEVVLVDAHGRDLARRDPAEQAISAHAALPEFEVAAMGPGWWGVGGSIVRRRVGDGPGSCVARRRSPTRKTGGIPGTPRPGRPARAAGAPSRATRTHDRHRAHPSGADAHPAGRGDRRRRSSGSCPCPRATASTATSSTSSSPAATPRLATSTSRRSRRSCRRPPWASWASSRTRCGSCQR